MKYYIIFFGIFFMFFSVNAQEKETEKEKISEFMAKERQKTSSFIVFPTISVNPANGWLFGLGSTANWVQGGDVTKTSISTAYGGLKWTTMHQKLATVKSTIFLEGNSWYLIGDWRYYVTSQPTYGLGTGPQSAKLASDGFEFEPGMFSAPISNTQQMEFDLLRIHETIFKKITDKVFMGLGYHLDIHSKIKDNLLNLDTMPEVITSNYAYNEFHGFNQEKYTTSGFSLNALYFDTRDNKLNPYKGQFFKVDLTYNPTWLGSDQSSTLLWLEYRTYFNLKKDTPSNLLAFWLFGNFNVTGTLPYLDLPALGWDQYSRTGRAYLPGRFRGKSMMYMEFEWRFPMHKIMKNLGGVAFSNFITVSNPDNNIGLLKYINTGVGVGLRYMVNNNRTNLCVDYGWGNYGSHSYYFGVNEVF